MIGFDNFKIWQYAMALVLLASHTAVPLLKVTAIVALRARRFDNLLIRTPMRVVLAEVSVVLVTSTK